jgi:transcriptional regulator with XRE-family HTH domain
MSITFLGERLKLIREQQRLTQSSFAERVRITQGALSNLEKGKQKPSPAMIFLLARELGVREEWLAEGKEPIYEEPKFQLTDRAVAEYLLEQSLGESQYDLDPGKREEAIGKLIDGLKVLRRDVKAEAKESEQPASPIIGNVLSGNFSNIKGDVFGGNKVVTQRHTTRVTNTPPPGSISQSEAREIHSLIVRVGELETMRLGQNAHGLAMNSFKKKFGVPSYQNLEATRFEEATKYLHKRIKTLEAVLRRKGFHPASRDDFIRVIQTICRQELGWKDPKRREVMGQRYGKASLVDFTMAELEDFRNYVQGLKSAKRTRKA